MDPSDDPARNAAACGARGDPRLLAGPARGWAAQGGRAGAPPRALWHRGDRARPRWLGTARPRAARAGRRLAVAAEPLATQRAARRDRGARLRRARHPALLDPRRVAGLARLSPLK